MSRVPPETLGISQIAKEIRDDIAENQRVIDALYGPDIFPSLGTREWIEKERQRRIAALTRCLSIFQGFEILSRAEGMASSTTIKGNNT